MADDSSSAKHRIIACPQCGRSARWSRDNPWRPFCSRRCKLIDLGAWLDGDRGIPDDEMDPGESEQP